MGVIDQAKGKNLDVYLFIGNRKRTKKCTIN